MSTAEPFRVADFTESSHKYLIVAAEKCADECRDEAMDAMVQAAITIERATLNRQAAAMWSAVAALFDYHHSAGDKTMSQIVDEQVELGLSTMTLAKFNEMKFKDPEHTKLWALVWAAMSYRESGNYGAAARKFRQAGDTIRNLTSYKDRARWAGDSFAKACLMAVVKPVEEGYERDRLKHFKEDLAKMEAAYDLAATLPAKRDPNELKLKAYQLIADALAERGGFGSVDKQIREKLRACRQRQAVRERQWFLAALLFLKGSWGFATFAATWMIAVLVLFPALYWMFDQSDVPKSFGDYVFPSLLFATTSGVWNMSPSSVPVQLVAGVEVVLSYISLALIIYLLTEYVRVRR